MYGFGEMRIEEVRELVSRLFAVNFSPRNGETFGDYYFARMLVGQFAIRENVHTIDGTPRYTDFGVQRILLNVTQVPDSDLVMARLLDNCPSAVVMVHDVYPDEVDDP